MAKSGYKQIYESLLPQLARCDFTEAAPRLGFVCSDANSLSVKFLGRDFTVSAKGVEPADGGSVNVNDRSLIAYYVLSTGSGEPEYSFLPLRHFSRSIIFQGSDTNWMTDPLSREFSGDYPKFRVAAEKIGAVFMGNSKNGDYLWRLSAFPKIPLQIAYSEADDEFPCEIKINFDSGVLRFMGFETVAFLNGSIVNALTFSL